MAFLYNPTLNIALSPNSDPLVTATVSVGYDEGDKLLAYSPFGEQIQLSAKLVGEDGTFFNGGDDDLFAFPSQFNIKDQTYTFQAYVSSGTLDEDTGDDEIYANFNLQFNNSNLSSFNINTGIDSNVINGNF